MNLTAILAILLAAAVAAGAFFYNRWDAADTRADIAEAALKTGATNEKIVTQYVETIVKISGPTVIRDRLVRGVCHNLALPSTGRPDAATGADPGAGQADGASELAADLAAAQRNRAKLEALQEVLRPQI